MAAAAICTGSNGFFKRWASYITGVPAQPAIHETSAGPPRVTKALLLRGDDATSSAIIGAFASDPTFTVFAQKEMDGILARDAEDAEKLSAGIAEAVARGTLEAEPPVEPVTKIDVAGKTADAVAAEIIAALGGAASNGCVLVLQGLSGTGKGTTVAKLQEKLPRCVAWSNGNVFRSLTLLAVSYCGAQNVSFAPDVFSGRVLAKLMKCLSFGKFDGKFDIQIDGFGHDLLVSKVANTTLKEPRVGKNIPSIAKLTQGEVIKFAGGAAEQMRADGMNVLMEGRSQTLDYVRTPHRFELTLAQPLVIGQRRAAQRMMAAALAKLGAASGASAAAVPTPDEVRATLKAELDLMAAA
jgi:cytidylate kinase